MEPGAPGDLLSTRERRAIDAMPDTPRSLLRSLSNTEVAMVPNEWRSRTPSPTRPSPEDEEELEEDGTVPDRARQPHLSPQPSTSQLPPRASTSHGRQQPSTSRPPPSTSRPQHSASRPPPQPSPSGRPPMGRWGAYDGPAGLGSSFRRTPPSSRRPSRPLPPKDYETIWMPWWTVRGRGPTRMERWAAYLLPPLNMGEDYGAIGGEVQANLRAINADVFDVISTVTTRYRRSAALRERQRQQVSRNCFLVGFG